MNATLNKAFILSMPVSLLLVYSIAEFRKRRTTPSRVQILVRRVWSCWLSVSNSLLGGDWELDEVPAVGDATHMVQIGRGRWVLTGEGQRCVPPST